MLEALLVAVGLISIVVLAMIANVTQSLVRWLVEGELKGAFSDYLEARVRTAAASLPADIAPDIESEWLEELRSCRDRPRLALRFTRGLSDAARSIRDDPEGAQASIMQSEELAAHETPNFATPPVRTRRPSVLVVDDEPTELLGTALSLRDLGVEVVEAGSIDVAMRLAGEHRFDLITIDQRMPKSGDDPADATDQQIEAFARSMGTTPFVWLTGAAVSHDRISIPGCVGVIEKANDQVPRLIEFFRRASSQSADWGAEHLLETVLLQLRCDDQGRFTGYLPSWRDEHFAVRPSALPEWLCLAVRAAPRQRVVVSAHGWLGAAHPDELDLSRYQWVSQADVDIWT